MVYTDVSSNIDLHILRILKFKTMFFQANKLQIDQEEVYTARTEVEEPVQESIAVGMELGDGVNGADGVDGDSLGLGGKTAADIEKYLINIFSNADSDKNGFLGPSEVRDMLVNSELDLSEEDVQVVLSSHDENEDGLLVYDEFIPIAIDLVQAHQASEYATRMNTKAKEDALKNAMERVQAAKRLPRLMEDGLADLDPEDTGKIEAKKMVAFLEQLPQLDLSKQEVEYVMASLVEEGGEILYSEFQANYEKALAAALQSHTLDKAATNVELFLTHLFRQQDKELSGMLEYATVREVLAKCERIRLSTTQIHAIMTGFKGQDDIDYKLFARHAAVMIYKLFDKDSLKEKTNVLKRSNITPIELLGSDSRKRIERQLREKFKEFDADEDGFLSQMEFHKLMSDTSLCLSATEIQAFMEAADLNEVKT